MSFDSTISVVQTAKRMSFQTFCYQHDVNRWHPFPSQLLNLNYDLPFINLSVDHLKVRSHIATAGVQPQVIGTYSRHPDRGIATRKSTSKVQPER